MRQNRVLSWRLAASSPLWALALVNCTLGGLSDLGAGPGDASRSDATSPVDASSEATTADAASGIDAPVDAGAARDADAATSLDAGAGDTATDRGDAGPLDVGADADDDAGEVSAEADARDAGAEMADADDGAPYVPASALPSWVDAGSPTWCTMHPGYAFCADFDETPLPAGFSADDGAFLTQTSSNPSSAPNDILLYVPPQTSAGSWGSKLSKSFFTPATLISLAFDIDPERLNSTSSGLLFAALDFLGNSSAKYSIRLAYNMGAPRLEESYLGSPSDIYHSNFVLPTKKWSHVQVDIAFAGMGEAGPGTGRPTETIYVDGVRQGVAEELTPPPGFDARPSLLIGGVYGTSPTNGWAIRYDNVTLDLQ